MMMRAFFLLTFTFALQLATTSVAQVHWLTWEEAQAKNQVEPRKIIVDVYTQWCGWCKKMDKATFEDPAISAYINKNYYAVKFDAQTKTDITFKGKVYKYVKQGESGFNELANEILFGRMSFPTIVFFDEKLNLIQPLQGYKDPESMNKIMKYFTENYYKTTPWKKYEGMCPSATPNATVPIKKD